MLDYSVSARINPMEKNEPAKYYAFSQCNDVMNLDQFAKHIATHGCVYKRSDIAAVLTMAVDCLREMLLNGTKVQLGDLGNFYVSFSSEGALTANEFNPEIHIKAVNVNLVAIRSVQKKVLKAVKNGESTVTIVDEEESTEGTQTGE